MFSILIPVFNELVNPLVERLNTLLHETERYYQIIVLDDGSDPHFKSSNSKVSEIMNVSYIELSENVGRAKIRNRLAKLARYDHLIFLDCDVSLIDSNFIKNYQNFTQIDCVCGGINYQKNPPSLQYFLHWKVGKKKEEMSAAKRNKSQQPLFFSSNFMIKADVFKSTQFDETIYGYGYEDLEFAQRLSEKGYKILHIDNQVQHDGLKDNDAFILDTKKAIENLAILYNQKKISQTSLIRLFERINTSPIASNIEKFLVDNQEFLFKKIKEKKPSLYYFDLWKLSLFIQKSQEFKAR